MSLIEMLLISSCVLIQPAKPPYMLLNDTKLDCMSQFKHDVYWRKRICVAFTNSLLQSLQSALSPTTINPARAVLMKCHSLNPRNKVKYSRWNCPHPWRGRKTPSKFYVKCCIMFSSYLSYCRYYLEFGMLNLTLIGNQKCNKEWSSTKS